MTFDRIARLRVRSVTLKATGTKLLVYQNDGPAEVLACLRDAIPRVHDQRGQDCVGYVLVAWGRGGEVSSDVRIRDGRFVGRSEAADFVERVVDHHIFGYDPMLPAEGA